VNEFPLWSAKRRRIDTVGKWREAAAPRIAEWRPYRRLAELARRWIVGPLDEIDALFLSQPQLGGFRAEEGFVEHKTTLDVHRGRFVHNLLIVGEAAGCRTLVSVEGVGDEPLGRLLAESCTDQISRGRAEMLSQRVFGGPVDRWGELSDTLLYAAAAAFIEARARGCAQVVLLLHEFRSSILPPQLVADNAGRIDRFVRRLSLGDEITPGRLLPMPAPAREQLAFFLGWAAVDLTA
jgi:hypothetical protein